MAIQVLRFVEASQKERGGDPRDRRCIDGLFVSRNSMIDIACLRVMKSGGQDW
jgi:hypothetical protein